MDEKKMLDEFKSMMKPAYNYAAQIQVDSRELLAKSKISDNDFKRLFVKNAYLQSIAMQLQIQSFEKMMEDMVIE